MKGDIKIVKYLEDIVIDIDTKNNQGQGIIHLAAKSDQPVSIVYFVQKELSVNDIDNKGLTPLHWACYLSMENSVFFLLSIKNIEINIKDYEGNTPLHLAVTTGNSRIVKKLLIKGADREMVNNQNQKAIDIAQVNEFMNIYKMLIQKEGLKEYFNVRPPIRPEERRPIQVLLFFIFYLGMLACTVFFIFPTIYDTTELTQFLICLLFSIIFYLFTWILDPGYMYSPETNLVQLLQENNDAEKICPECKIVKPDRSRHCDICKKCVRVYDHHCPWTANCVGVNNHRFFIFFVFFITMTILLQMYLAVIHLNDNYQDDIHLQFLNWFEGYSDDQLERIRYLKLFIIPIVQLTALTFLLPLCFLFWIQLNNFLLNQTTFERFSQHVKEEESEEGSDLSHKASKKNDDSQEEVRKEQKIVQKMKAFYNARSAANCAKMAFHNSRNPNYNLKRKE